MSIQSKWTLRPRIWGAGLPRTRRSGTILTKTYRFQMGLLGILFFTTGCSNARLFVSDPPSRIAEANGGFCTSPPAKVDGPVKFLFIIDKSESNVNCDEPGPCGQLAAQGTGTDPANAQRADRIEEFFNGVGPHGVPRKDDENISWGYIAFSSTARAFINGGDIQDPIFASPLDTPSATAQMEQALAQQRGPDAGGTKYLSALALASKAIQNDMKKPGSEKSSYILYFMTDGLPDDFGGSRPAQQQHFDAVDQLMQISPGRIRLNTAFYGPPEIQVGAAEGLETMAKHGNGRFINLNVSDDFLVDDLLEGSEGSIPYKLKTFNSFVVYNLNSAICFDQKWGMDSDADGLCDRDEAQLTREGRGDFDPQRRFSFGDSYSDYFHYIALQTGDTLPSCPVEVDGDFDFLTPCEEVYMRNLNAPAEIGTTEGDSQNPDTDGDGIIDGLEYFMLRNRSAPIDPGNLVQHYDSDFETAYQQILQHRNPLVPDSHLGLPEIYDTVLTYQGLGYRAGSCYSLRQTALKTYPTLAPEENYLQSYLNHAADENVILIYYLQVPEDDPKAKGVYRYAFLKLRNNQAIDLHVTDKIFSTLAL